MGIYCIESLGRTYQETDETFDFFEKVLMDYLEEAEDHAEVIVNKATEDYFLALEELHSISVSKGAEDWNEEEKMADALAFAKSTGLISIKNGNYVLNGVLLKKKYEEYEAHKEKTASYTKGSKK